MSPLLFALVDAVLAIELTGAVIEVNHAAFMPLPHFTLAMGQMNDAAQALGWWRSTWGVR